MSDAKVEREGFGLVYERYAVGKLLEDVVNRYKIASVLEIPAGGVKAMPSIYSIALALAGCEVTLLNGERKSLEAWDRLGLSERITFVDCDNPTHTQLADQSYDFVWNFVVFGMMDQPFALLKEMKRVSRKYVGLFLSNKRNLGFYFHRFAHWYTGIPWTHGDVELRKPKRIKHLMEKEGIRVEKTGLVDTPPWPDSIGFRDIRLHRLAMEKNVDLSKIEWASSYLDFLEKDGFPLWIKLVYAFERFPLPNLLKQFYAHLFYVIGAV